MNRVVIPVALLLFSVAPLCANQVDYFCIFTNEAAAQVDGAVGQFWDTTNLVWNTSTVFPGVKVATPAALINGISPITGFWILVSTVNGNAALDAKVNCVMKLDRDLGKTNGAFVLGGSLSGTNRTSLTFTPVPHGSQYPRPLGK